MSRDERSRAHTDTEFIEGQHGRHGGGLESEGKPQEKQPESSKPSDTRGDANRQSEDSPARERD